MSDVPIPRNSIQCKFGQVNKGKEMGSFEVGMPELGEKFIYTLAEVATILDISENKILQFMANGVIDGLIFFGLVNSKIGFTKPRKESCDDIRISFMDKDLCDNNSNQYKDKTFRNSSYFGYLRLSQVDASSLLLKGVCEQHKFIEILRQSDSREDILGKNRRRFARKLHRSISRFPFFIFRSAEAPISGLSSLHRQITLDHPLTIRTDSIHIDLGEILFLVRNYALPTHAQTLASIRYRHFFNKVTCTDFCAKNRSLFEFKRKAFHSQKLVNLIQVAIHFWGTLYFEFDKFPDIDNHRNIVLEYLVREYGFDRKLAKTATKIICPTYARHRPEITSQLKYLGFSSTKLDIVIKASEYFYSMSNLEDRSSFPDMNVIEQWFKEKHNFPPSIAVAAAMIIEPTKEDVDDLFHVDEFAH
jgi:hypothetical protein